MNNSRVEYNNIYEEPKVDSEAIERRKSELTAIVEALKRVSSTSDWKTLKRLIFDGVVRTLQARLLEESSKHTVSDSELYRIQGQMLWARKFSDLDKLAEFFRKQVEGIKMTHEQETSGDGAPTSS